MVQALADLATIAIIQERLDPTGRAPDRAASVRPQQPGGDRAGEGCHRPSLGVSVEEAFVLMRGHARRERVGLTDLALRVVQSPRAGLRPGSRAGMGHPPSAVEPIAEALPAMQALASHLWTPETRHHPGQLAWSYAYGLPDVLDHGPAAVQPRRGGGRVGWAESDDWMELVSTPLPRTR